MILTLAREIINVEADLEQLLKYIDGEKRIPKGLRLPDLREQHAIESARLVELRNAEAQGIAVDPPQADQTEAERQDVITAQVLRAAARLQNAEVEKCNRAREAQDD